MADWGQFDEDRMHEAELPPACQVCEAMLPDAVDGALSEAEQRAFDRHVAGCVVCARELEEAQRGAAWLGMLKQQTPEPSAALLERIFAQTTGSQANEVRAVATSAEALVAQAAEKRAAAMRAAATVSAGAVDAWEMPAAAAGKAPSRWTTLSGGFSLGWMRPMLQPRMAMTAAMAFFSIALTLNLTGVRLGELSTASLRPSSVRRAVAERSASAVRSFQNMRVVYQAEAQVNDLHSNWREQENESAPASQPREEAKPKRSQSENPEGSSKLDAVPADPRATGMTEKGA